MSLARYLDREAAPAFRSGRLVYLALIGTGSLFAVVAVTLARSVALGIDYAFYRDIGARWLADGSYYLPHQLAGPYDLALMADVLYPPSALFLFVPAALLPAALWWIVPIAVTGYVLWRFRPSPLAIVIMLLLLSWPRAIGAYLYGNTDMWAAAAVAAGLRWGWPAVALTMKPVFVPFALVGIKRRSWWIVAGLGLLVCLAMLPLWLDYLRAMSNMAFQADYSLGSLPMLLVPLVAWAGRKTAKLPQPPLRLAEPFEGDRRF